MKEDRTERLRKEMEGIFLLARLFFAAIIIIGITLIVYFITL